MHRMDRENKTLFSEYKAVCQVCKTVKFIGEKVVESGKLQFFAPDSDVRRDTEAPR